MTARAEDPNLITWLRSLQADVARLKAGAGVKQNNIRLGDWVCLIDDDGCLVATNVNTAEQTITCPSVGGGEIEEIVWSIPGPIDQDFLDSLTTNGPVWYPPADIVVIEVGMFLRVHSMTSGSGIQVRFITHGEGTIAETSIGWNAEDKFKCYQTPPPLGPVFDENGSYRGEWFASTVACNISKGERVAIELGLPEGIPVSLGDDLTAVLRYRFV